MRPRLFSTHLAAGQRRVYRGALAFFLGVFLAMIWPVVTLFSHVRPLILGLPFFLFYLAVLLVASFLVLLGLYLWEERSATRDGSEDSP